MASFHKDFTIETVEEDEERVAYDETFKYRVTLNNLEMELTNDCADMWVKGVETQETAFQNLMVHSNFALARALIRFHKRRKYRSRPKKLRKKRVTVHHNKNYWNSIWGQLIRHPSNSVPNTTMYKRFRRRFRVPFELFGPLVQECRDNQIFASVADLDGRGRTKKVPIEFKILCALRMLGRDAFADDIAEILDIGEETPRLFFLVFVRGVSQYMYEEYVYPPTGEELDKVVEGYRRAGFPGCVGSMDCTHIIWDRAAKKVGNMWCKGSAHSKTLSYEVVCDHFRRIHHVSVGFYGSNNDKHCMFNDTYPMDLVHKRIHSERTFVTYNDLGQPTTWRGAWMITDNGYTRYMSLQCPNHHATAFAEVMFSEWVESVRKDIECTFGTMKARFRILQNAVRLYFEDDIDHVVRTCAVLHNILLEFDGFMNVDWETIDPNIEEPEVDLDATQPLDLDPDNTQDVRQLPLQQRAFALTQHEPEEEPIQWNQDMFYELRAALAKHLAYQYRHRRVEWPKTFTGIDKQTWTPDLILNRTEARFVTTMNRGLYIRDSVLRRRDRIGKFNMPIGLGLFAKTQFEVGDKVAVFNGELFFNLDEFDNERAGHKPYILHSKQADMNGNGEWLDCFLTRRNNKCMASVSNSPYACFNTKTGRMAVPNCCLKVSHQSDPTKFSLEAITVIKENDEILWSYGAQYIYPPEYPTNFQNVL